MRDWILVNRAGSVSAATTPIMPRVMRTSARVKALFSTWLCWVVPKTLSLRLRSPPKTSLWLVFGVSLLLFIILNPPVSMRCAGMRTLRFCCCGAINCPYFSCPALVCRPENLENLMRLRVLIFQIIQNDICLYITIIPYLSQFRKRGVQYQHAIILQKSF